MDALRLDAILRANDVVAVLAREVPVRLVDISGSGCRLESAHRIEVGTTGTVRVRFEGVDYFDDVRVMRCVAFDGSSSLYQAGAEFLWTTRPAEQSLRRIVPRLEAGALKPERLEGTKFM